MRNDNLYEMVEGSQSFCQDTIGSGKNFYKDMYNQNFVYFHFG